MFIVMNINLEAVFGELEEAIRIYCLIGLE